MRRILSTAVLAATLTGSALAAAPAQAHHAADDGPLHAFVKDRTCTTDPATGDYDGYTREKVVIKNLAARLQTVTWSATVKGDEYGPFDTGTEEIQPGHRIVLNYDHIAPERIEVDVVKGYATNPKRVLLHRTFRAMAYCGNDAAESRVRSPQARVR